MQQTHATLRQAAAPFDRQGAQQLILGGFGAPVGVPAPQLVVADAADPGRQAREMGWLVPGHGAGNRLGQQQGAERIHGEAGLQGPPFDRRQPFFGLQVASMQHTGGVDNQTQGLPLGFGQRFEGLEAGIVTQVEPAGIALLGCASGQVELQLGRLILQLLDQSPSDAAATDDQGMALPLLPGGLCWPVHAPFRGPTAWRMMAAMTLRITVLGRGAWGGTLMTLWQGQGHQVDSWSRADGHLNPKHLLTSDLVVSAIAMAGIHDLASRLAPHWPSGLPLLSCSKGIDLQRLETASQLWCRGLGQRPRLAVLSGPNLARELQQGLPAASTLASDDPELGTWLQRHLSGETLRLYRHHDPLGTEAAGALKNVIAIAAGICDGLELGANAKASLLCRGLVEIGQVVSGLGGQSSTLYGLAGLGDLLATASSPLSRNYRMGLLLAQGCTADEALARIQATVEGVQTANAALALARQRGWHLPICEQVAAVIGAVVTPAQAVQALMGRELKAELRP